MKLAPALITRLVANARKVRGNAYVPYSRFAVGAAVLTANGRIFSGCNVENASFGLTICAERNAVASAIAAGQRPIAVAVVSENGQAAPCGACRQVLAEFSPDMSVVLAAVDGDAFVVYSLNELLPALFRFPAP